MDILFIVIVERSLNKRKYITQELYRPFSNNQRSNVKHENADYNLE